MPFLRVNNEHKANAQDSSFYNGHDFSTINQVMAKKQISKKLVIFVLNQISIENTKF